MNIAGKCKKLLLSVMGEKKIDELSKNLIEK